MKTLTLLALTSTALSVAAQTSTAHPATAAHRPPATAHTATAAGGCVPAPTVSPKVPALPASAACTKALFTLTRTPETQLEYGSPLLSTELRQAMDQKKETISLLYSEIAPGSGALVKRGSYLTIKYTGWLTDGTKFDSSEDHPNAEPLTLQYGVGRVIPGWNTGFEGMHVGGKRRLYIPYQLAYGESGRPPVIPQRATLIFDVEIVSQSDTQPQPKAAPAPAAPPAGEAPAKPAAPPTAEHPAAAAPATTSPAPAATQSH